MESKSHKRLRNEFQRIQESEEFLCSLVDDNIYKWRIHVKNTFNGVQLGEDLSLLAAIHENDEFSYMVFEVAFGYDYPLSPPSVRLVLPRLQPSPHSCVDAGGVIHCSLLTKDEWTPVTTISKLMNEILSTLVATDARVDLESVIPYSELEALTAINGIYEHMIVRSPAHAGCVQSEESMGGKVILPQSLLQRVANLDNIVYPLIIELSRTSRTKITHAGALSFEAPPHTAIIPSWIMKNLDLAEGDYVSVRLVTLPKGKYIKLKPHEPDSFFALSQPKEILESVLRSFNAITQGDTLQINYDGSTFNFEVLETRPFNAIDIHNVDVEVEFFGETKPLETWKPDTSDQQKAATNSIAQDEGHKVGHGSANESYETVQCDNCLRKVPAMSLQSHTIFCRRNNALCHRCNQVYLMSQKAQHEQEMHSTIECSCGQSVEIWELSTHKAVHCLHRMEKCKFCGLSKKVIELMDHESYCGSRTEQCTSCNRFIMLKDLEQHFLSNCEYPLPKATQPTNTPPPQQPTVLSRVLGLFFQR